VLGIEEGFFMILQAYYDIEKKKKKQNNSPNLSIIRTVLFWDTKLEKIEWQKQKKKQSLKEYSNVVMKWKRKKLLDFMERRLFLKPSLILNMEFERARESLDKERENECLRHSYCELLAIDLQYDTIPQSV
jgi:hypothetical protein